MKKIFKSIISTIGDPTLHKLLWFLIVRSLVDSIYILLILLLLGVKLDFMFIVKIPGMALLFKMLFADLIKK